MSTETNAGTGAGDQVAGDQGADSLDAVIGAYRDQAKNLPGVIPELIQGKTLAEVNGSIDASKAAFERIKGQVAPAAAGGSQQQAQPTPVVGTGAASGVVQGEAKITMSTAFAKIATGFGKGQSR